MAKNLVLSEAEFDDFQRYCREKGFDLSYFSGEISGSKEEMERHQFDSPKVIKFKRQRFSSKGIPYDVAEWQREKWDSSLPQIQDEFFKKGMQRVKVDSFSIQDKTRNG